MLAALRVCHLQSSVFTLWHCTLHVVPVGAVGPTDMPSINRLSLPAGKQQGESQLLFLGPAIHLLVPPLL
jgi:hypothetical protein